MADREVLRIIRAQMVFGWLDSREVDAFAAEVVAELLQRLPPAGLDLSTKKALERKATRGIIAEITLPKGATLESGKARYRIVLDADF